MFTKSGRLGSLLDEYLDRWLQIQVVQRPEKRVGAGGRGGMVMVCGPCAERKAAVEAGEERQAP